MTNWKPKAKGSRPKPRAKASVSSRASVQAANAASDSRRRMKGRLLALEGQMSTLQSSHKELIQRLIERGELL